MPDREPGLRIHVVLTDPVQAERLRIRAGRWKDLDIRITSECPVREGTADLWVLPVELLEPAGPDNPGRARPPVIGYGSPRALRQAFLAGCEDFLKEPWDADELECRIRRSVRQRQRSLSFSWGLASLEEGRFSCPRGRATLTHQEGIILKILLLHRAEVISREVLYYAIWGRPPGGGSRVVDVHISSLRKKLGGLLPEGRGCIEAVRNRGYRFSSR